ncbi:protein kintoun isoform X1 [Gymnodraco acuticeps]|uniref:Protein kintoun n=1 Tax=Gymnodraco acuticeps TaxID=8218 RepID=A0A6P8VQC3_GYMAC|nr:protein kintoun isoform X1 [Gymnodraco acuticeps]
MAAVDKLKELNITVDEIDRLSKAFKDEKFKEMLFDYAHELSDPENKKRYEEEIKLLEQERGNTIEFIHPKPSRVLKTSVNGKQKCFINICSNDKVGKPERKLGVSEEGRRGQCWALPHSLHPGRQDTDPKGNKIMIYDVIFHPDTLHLASRNRGFTNMVDSTAIQGIQDHFKVTLDKNNVREIKSKYKGLPQPCVIRKPIPGYKMPSEEPDPLAFPYPDEKRPTPQTKPTKSPASKNINEATPKSIPPQKVKEPTKPNYTVKYRSFTDIQDFRYARDSAQSPRPKEIVVTIDMPLLKAATEASLEVKECRLMLLESKEPAYRLELPLAYPVDEDKGEAKFNKQKQQLTVTLPVLPSKEAFDFHLGPAQSSVSDVSERQEENTEMKEEDKCIEEDLRNQTGEEEVEEERGQEIGEEQMSEGQESVGEKDTWRKQKREGENTQEEISVEEEAECKEVKEKGQEGVVEDTLKKQKEESLIEVGDFNLEKNETHGDKNETHGGQKDPVLTGFEDDTVDASAEGENALPVEDELVASPETENQPVLIPAEHSSSIGTEGGVHQNSCLESPPKLKTSDINAETGKKNDHVSGDEVEDASFLYDRSGEESQTFLDANAENNIKGCDIPQESSEMPAAEEATKSSRGDSEDGAPPSPEESRGGVDEDDLPTEQIFRPKKSRTPPALLREIDEDGNETVISDHSTSAGFIFQNSLMFELD